MAFREAGAVLVGAGSYPHVPVALGVGRVVTGVVRGADLPLQLQVFPQSYVHFAGCKYRHSKPGHLSAQPWPGDTIVGGQKRSSKA